MIKALFADFPPATRDEWIDAVRGSLRGAPLESLRSPSAENIEIYPLPHADDLRDIHHHHSLPGQFPFVRSARAGGYRSRTWQIANELDISDPRAFNAALKDALARGQTAITITDRLSLKSAADLRQALADIDLRRRPLFVQSARASQIYRWLAGSLDDETLQRLRGCVGFDPLASLARSGVMPDDAFTRLASHVSLLAAQSPRLDSIAVDAAAYHDAGATATQELSLALATAVACLRELHDRGLPVESAAPKLHFFFRVGEDFFIEIAKFRAFRLLWAQVLRAFDLESAMRDLRVHARSGIRNKSRLDPHLNLLRLTTEALSAAIGGVDSICLAPHDAGDDSRRLARNLHLILREELRLPDLIDPAGGSWHVEKLTDQLAREAWSRFQAIEAGGGLPAALRAGGPQTEIREVAERRRRGLADGDAVLVGCNKYVAADLPDPPAPSLPQPNPASAIAEGGVRAQALQPLRLAQPYENRRQTPRAGS